MKVIVTDCQPKDYGPEYRPVLSKEFAYGEILELTQAEFIRLIQELTRQPWPKAVLGPPFIAYDVDEDALAITVYNYYQE